MKNSVFLIVLALLLSNNLKLKAQDALMLDSVTFQMNDHLSMEVISRNFHDLSEWGNIDSLYALFLDDLSGIEVSVLNDGKANNLNYVFDGPYRKIQINKESALENEVSIDKKGNMIYFQTAEFRFNQKERLIFKSPSLEGFKEIGNMKLDNMINSADTLVSPKGKGKRNHKSMNLYIDNGRVLPDSNIGCGRGMINFGIDVGMGTVRTTLTPDLEIGLFVSLSKKGLFMNHFGMSYQSLFFFQDNEDGNQEIKNDGFVNLIYVRTILNANNSSKVVTTGIKAGVMVDHNSKAFVNDAYKFAMLTEKGMLGIEGGLYFENNFNDWYPYIRLSFGFY